MANARSKRSSDRTVARNQQAPVSPLLTLPAEVLLNIIRQIRSPRDLSSVSRVCKYTHSRVLPLLYRHLVNTKGSVAEIQSIGFLESMGFREPLGLTKLTALDYINIEVVKRSSRHTSGRTCLLHHMVQSLQSIRRLKFGREVMLSPPNPNDPDEATFYRILHDDLNLTLKRFWLRCEEDTDQLRVGLKSFLISFSGLEHLAVLLDNSKAELGIGTFPDKHGKTLRTFIWESRRGPRKTIETSTSHFLDSYHSDIAYQFNDLMAICKYCTQLEQLGIALDWNSDEGHRVLAALEIADLPHLRTLQIRNQPVICNTIISLMESYEYWEENYESVPQAGTQFSTIMAELLLYELLPAPWKVDVQQQVTGIDVIAIGAFNVADSWAYSRVDETVVGR
ncbi:hypothetical protein MMC30_008012 [Trapelia coarctata]|nr:hypothetical protein [Trapelia coarctata]